MEKVLVILSLFGCSDSGTQCELLQTADQLYRSQAACERRVDAVLRTAGRDAPYPTVIVHCGTAEETARVLDDLSPGRTGNAAIAVTETGPFPSS